MSSSYLAALRPKMKEWWITGILVILLAVGSTAQRREEDSSGRKLDLTAAEIMDRVAAGEQSIHSVSAYVWFSSLEPPRFASPLRVGNLPGPEATEQGAFVVLRRIKWKMAGGRFRYEVQEVLPQPADGHPYYYIHARDEKQGYSLENHRGKASARIYLPQTGHASDAGTHEKLCEALGIPLIYGTEISSPSSLMRECQAQVTRQEAGDGPYLPLR